jgi:sugar O-acyltransferase (sialic acid O-acetyltransferase NeuD family)
MRAAQPLVIVGAGGFARETVQLLRAHPAAGRAGEAYEVLGYLDGNPDLHGTTVDGTPVLGPPERAAELADRGTAVLVCVGNPRARDSRARLVTHLALPDEAFATVVHPAASVSPDSEVGVGSVLHAGTVLTAAVRLGRHAVVMPHVVLTHDDRVGDCATFAAGARLAGGVEVGDAAYLGCGALVREGLRIGAGALVGIGSVVLRDIPAGEVWAGSPARRLRPVAPDFQMHLTSPEDRP